MEYIRVINPDILPADKYSVTPRDQNAIKFGG